MYYCLSQKSSPIQRTELPQKDITSGSCACGIGVSFWFRILKNSGLTIINDPIKFGIKSVLKNADYQKTEL